MSVTPTAASPSSKKFKILVVEDDDQFRSALRIFLMLNKFEVIEAADGKAAKSCLSINTVDLIVSDIRMPHVYGTELLRFVRKTSQVPFILMTGFSDIIEAAEAYAIGANGFVPKPFKPEEMLATIHKCLPQLEQAEAPGNEADENAEKFCRIHVDDFLGGKASPVDLFVRLAQDRYIKIAHKGTQVLGEQIVLYKSKNVHFLYIREADFASYVSTNLKISNIAAGHAQASSPLKSKILKLTQECILQDIYLAGLDKSKFENAAQVTELTLATVASNPDILRLMNDLNTQTDYLYAHSVGVSVYSVMLAQEIGWHSSQILYKLALAGMLHDIGKKEMPRELLDKSRAQMTAAEMKLLESHGYRGKEILASVPDVPSDVIAITLQHHENMYGQGPLGMDAKSIHPLAKVVALANRFCELTVKNPARKLQTASEAIETIRVLGVEEFDPPVFAALESIVRGASATGKAS